MYNPKVSIVIPVYNGSNYLAEAIDSALAQTYENIEIVVVNDGSSDDGATEKIALSYGDKIRYVSKENGGVSSALNCGIRNAAGEWISWLSHDDMYEPEKVAVQVADAAKLYAEGVDVSKVMFYCMTKFINEKRQHIPRNDQPLSEGLYFSGDYLKEYYHGHELCGCALLLPKQMFEEVGYFEEDMRFAQDAFMWQKALIAGYGICINHRALSITRIHNMQASTTAKAYLEVDRKKLGAYMLEHLDEAAVTDGTDLLKCYMLFCARKNNLHVAKAAFEKLSAQKRLSFAEKVHYYGMTTYGKMRKKMVTVYYRVRFGTKR